MREIKLGVNNKWKLKKFTLVSIEWSKTYDFYLLIELFNYELVLYIEGK